MKKIYWTSVAILILFGMQGAELKSHEKTTAGSLIVDHEVSREDFSYFLDEDGEPQKRVRIKCTALKRVRYNGTGGSAYVFSRAFAEVVHPNMGEFVVRGYIRGSANQGLWRIDMIPMDMREELEVGVASQWSRYKHHQLTPQNAPAPPGENGVVHRDPKRIAYSGWRQLIIRHDTLNAIAALNVYRPFELKEYGNVAVAAIPSSIEGSARAAWLKKELKPFAFAGIIQPTNQGAFFPDPMFLSTNEEKTNVDEEGNHVATLNTHETTGSTVDEQELVVEDFPQPPEETHCSVIWDNWEDGDGGICYNNGSLGCRTGGLNHCGSEVENCCCGSTSTMHPCGVHPRTASGIHTLVTDCSLYSQTSCTSDNYYACQPHTHVLQPFCGNRASGASACRFGGRAPTATSHQRTCRAGHRYWMCDSTASHALHTASDSSNNLGSSSGSGSSSSGSSSSSSASSSSSSTSSSSTSSSGILGYGRYCGNASTGWGRCIYGREASNSAEHQRICAAGHYYYSCSAPAAAAHSAHTANSSGSGSGRCGNSSGGANACVRGRSASFSTAHQTTCRAGHRYWACDSEAVDVHRLHRPN